MAESAALHRVTSRYERARTANPLSFYRPTDYARQLYGWIGDPAVTEILFEGGNRVSKTMSAAAGIAALADGIKAPWAPKRRPKWVGRLQVAHIVVTQDQARGDSLRLVHGFLSAATRAEVALSRVGLLELPHMDIHTIGWLGSIERARARLQGLNAHIVWVNEECPPELFEEAAARGASTQGVRLITATMGLELSSLHASKLDPDFFVERAKRGPECGHPKCHHTPEAGSGHRHLWIPFARATTPWLTDRQRQRHIDGLPEASRNIRLGLDRGRIVTGRCWYGYDPQQHDQPFTLADIAGSVAEPGKVQLWLVGDLGATDAVAFGAVATYEETCADCSGRGVVVCTTCRGRPGGCSMCAAQGRSPCLTCRGLGFLPHGWCLGDYQSEPGSSTDDNVAGLREMVASCGIVDIHGGADFGPGRWDRLILDNIRPKQYTEHKTEGHAIRARLGGGLPEPTFANKSRSYTWSWDQAAAMHRAGRLREHPRAERSRRMMLGWAWGKNGAPPAHDGPQGHSHADAWRRYWINAMCAPREMRLGR